MRLKAHRLDLVNGGEREMSGDELLSQPSHEEWTDPITGSVYPAEVAGATVLINALSDPASGYGTHIQDQSIQSLETFFTFERGNLSTHDYMQMWNMCFQDAEEHGGLQLNNVGKSFLLLWKSGLSVKEIYDYRMQVGGDLSRFEDIRAIINRFTSIDSQPDAGAPTLAKNFYGTTSYSYDDDNYWPLSDREQYYNDGYTDDYDCEHYDYDTTDYSSWYDEQSEESYYGKGKHGKSTGKAKEKEDCTQCGSKYHRSADCPLGQSKPSTEDANWADDSTWQEEQSWADDSAWHDEDSYDTY